MKSNLRILCLFLLIHTTGNAQDTNIEFCPMGKDSTAQQKISMMSTSSTTLLNDGMYITAHGELKVLIVFVRFPDDDLDLGTWWRKNEDPTILSSIIIPSSNTNSANKYNLTHFFDVMSVGEFDIIGEAISVVAPQTAAGYGNNLGVASKDILEYVSDNDLVNFANYDN